MAAVCEGAVNVLIAVLLLQALLLWPILPFALLDAPTSEVTVEIDLPR